MEADQDHVDWKETVRRLRRDRLRLATLIRETPRRGRASVWFSPSYTCVLLYRLSHYLYLKRHRLLARFLWHLNVGLTAADISPVSDLGSGLVVVSPAGVTIDGNAKTNLTVMPLSGLGGEVGSRVDVGAGIGLPVLGDDVYLAPHSGVLGPVRIGDRVRLAPGVFVTRDLPDDTTVQPFSIRFFKRSHLR